MRLVAALALAAVAHGETLLIMHKWDDSAGYYDGVSGKQLTALPINRKPHEFELSHDRKHAYVTNYGVDTYTEDAPGGNTVSILDVAARKLAGVIDLGSYRRPHGIHLGKSGRLYVTCDLPPSLLVVDPVKRTVLRAIGIENPRPHMVAVTDDETTAYTANSGDGTVSVVDLRVGRAIRSIVTGGVPMGVMFSADAKRLYVATRPANAVAVIDIASGKLVEKIDIQGHPVRLARTPDNRYLLVSLIDSGEVAILSLPDHKIVTRFRAGDRCEGLAVHPGGKFGYIAVQAENKVLKFSIPDGKVALAIPTRERPDPIAVLD